MSAKLVNVQEKVSCFIVIVLSLKISVHVLRLNRR